MNKHCQTETKSVNLKYKNLKLNVFCIETFFAVNSFDLQFLRIGVLFQAKFNFPSNYIS